MAVNLSNTAIELEGGYLFVTLAAAIGLGEAAWIGIAWRALSTTGDSRVSVSRAQMQRGETFELRVEVPAPRGARIVSELEARVLCVEHAVVQYGRFTQLAKRVVDERVFKLTEETAVPPGEVLRGTGKLYFAATSAWPPSGYGRNTNFRYFWELRVELPGAKELNSVYPLEVV